MTLGPGVPGNVDGATSLYGGGKGTRRSTLVADDVVGAERVGRDEAVVSDGGRPAVVVWWAVLVVVAIGEPSTVPGITLVNATLIGMREGNALLSIDGHPCDIAVTSNKASRGEKPGNSGDLGHGHG